ncbi:MAG TPA: hypothetical protein VNS79_04690 [Sphingobium sp.]|nr:hypothetical protein [Sphingobium sp.]
MSLDLIDALAEAAAHLRAAMQAADLSAIEQATARFQTALTAVQGVGAWRTNPEAKARVKRLIEELDAARTLACLLGDRAGQQHLAIAQANPDAPQPLYERPR